MAVVRAVDPESWLLTHYVPSGHRLGILVESSAPQSVIDTASGAIERHGLTAERRLAHLHPRPGEAACRAEDIADFLTRYGHEYSVAVLTTVDADVQAAADRGGCTLFVVGLN